MRTLYQVFVSSTYIDLQQEREKIAIALRSMNCIAVGMEQFPAIDEEQFEYIKTVLDVSDYYVLVLGARYGSLARDGVSYTEKEFDYAVTNNIPIVAIIHGNPTELTKFSDGDKRIEKKMAAFRKKALNGRIVSKWLLSEEITSKVVVGIEASIRKFPRPGYVRNSKPSALALSKLNRHDLANAYANLLEDQIGDRPIVTDLSVEYIFNKHPHNPDSYLLTQRDRFTIHTQKSQFTLILSDDTELLNRFLAHGSVFDFVLGMSDIRDCDNAVLNSIELTAIPEGSSRRKPVATPKTILTQSEAESRLHRAGLDNVDISRIRVLDFNLPAFDSGLTLVLARQLTMRLKDNYYSWFADGLTFLRSLKFSYSGIADIGRDFNVQHFFSSEGAIFDHDELRHECYIEYDNWVVRGQGAILVWR